MADSSATIDSLLELFGGDYIEVSHRLAEMSGEYEERMPTIMEFITSPRYLGKVLVDGDGNLSVYPIWVEALKEIYPTPYTTSGLEIFLAGGIGLGKTTCAKIITLYDIAHLLCLKNPHRSFKLLPTTIIRYMLMNATKALAGDVLLGEILEWIENSPFFRDKLSTKGDTLFIKKIDIGMGSRGKDALGQATVGAIFSEINDMTVVHGQADDVFDTIYTRMKSRFDGKGRPMIGHIIIDSSNKGVRSFSDIRIEQKVEKEQNDFIVFKYPHWAAKWHLGGYSGVFFKVFAGDQHKDPCIIEDDIEPQILALYDPSRIIDVPVEHRQEFEFNIIKSLRDLAGVSTFGTWSFISSTEVLEAAAGHVNPVSRDSAIVLDFFDEEQQLADYIDLDRLLFLNQATRFIHLDLGIKSDSTGIACSYLKEYRDFEIYDPVTSKRITVRSPVIDTEWVMEITCVPGQEVPIYKLKNFILTMNQKGYQIGCVSTDGYQSTNLRQDLTLAGIEAQLISVDRNKDPYNNLRNAILEGRYIMPNHPKLKKELKELEELDGKYDHPSDGSKDVADAACGSHENCLRNLQKVGHMKTMSDMSKALDKMHNSQLGSASAGRRFNDIIARSVNNVR